MGWGLLHNLYIFYIYHTVHNTTPYHSTGTVNSPVAPTVCTVQISATVTLQGMIQRTLTIATKKITKMRYVRYIFYLEKSSDLSHLSHRLL